MTGWTTPTTTGGTAALVTPDDTAPWHPQAEAAEPLAMRELDDPPPRAVPPRDA
ncbi:MAG: hypothetical protein QOI28_1315, partial [Mycobacterium sp.]|nr:hypothetical protein [Mycobacterium sp.]